MGDSEAQSKRIFQSLKAVCVPLLGSAVLTPTSVPTASKLLSELIFALRTIKSSESVLSESLISYTFFPISTILQRNTSTVIPDQILEKIFVVLEILCDDWWWSCEVSIWQQMFMLSGAVLGGMEGNGKAKERDDETKEAAARCLFTLLRVRTEEDERIHSNFAEQRLTLFREHARTEKFVPILGQTLNSLLINTDSRTLSLQKTCLDVVHLLLSAYFPDSLFPSVLPGVVSTTTKLALGTTRKGWANGDLVSRALGVLSEIVVRSIADDICAQEGAVTSVEDLEDVINLVRDPEAEGPPTSVPKTKYATIRTPSWLRGTSSQLHIALNTLTPLVKHPTPSALIALSKLSSTILLATSTTLPQTQPLLLSFLLSLSISDFPSVSKEAHTTLLGLLSPWSRSHHAFMRTLMLLTRDNLSALPRLLPLMADAKVEHIAGLIEAVCRLSSGKEGQTLSQNPISTELGRLLGPTGSVEKWGWNLLSVMEFVDPPITITKTSSALLMLEHDSEQNQWVAFPDMIFRNISLRSTYDALVKMFHVLGQAAGDGCLFTIEWFVSVGQSGTGSRSVAALWCACRLLEGAARISLSSSSLESPKYATSKRLDKLARSLARSTSQIWDRADVDAIEEGPGSHDQEEVQDEVQHRQGVIPINETLHILQSYSPATKPRAVSQPTLHRAMLLQLLSITSGILQARFAALFIQTLYPVLHSLVSPNSHLSSTALAALNYITTNTSYASPANLLLSNFDYVLDSVSRRLTRRWLDVEATKVLVVMIQLVGDGVVEKAGDVVEECFDRLDEYHGYEVLVEGLIEVLSEVMKVIKMEEVDVAKHEQKKRGLRDDREPFNNFFDWFERRNDLPVEEEDVDYGPAPREAWGDQKGKGVEGQEEVEAAPAAAADSTEDPPPTPTQALTKHIVSRSLYFLTHQSPIIRARILTLLASSVAVLPESALLPSVHSAWPFILNRLSDTESFVVSAAASLVEALATHVGAFMHRRIWDDIWPRFRTMLEKLDVADASSALSRRRYGAVGTESAYTHSHRIYRCLLKTMTASMRGVDPKDTSVWEVTLAFRRFLDSRAHEELQSCARELYIAVGCNNADAVWLALQSTHADVLPTMNFLRMPKWDIENNVVLVFKGLEPV
ncbi:armadillo-type protein [Armillaria luteobubalina]|uniref:Armadillo-type protein n=1 Tax=Armillaria luteobubalina TaxID=153913 RepID=A0AA39QMG6_9AGAR|nr:armadillo-type protein [Armillaria luteobubalina]